jgi:NADPH:quinone reductase-like Zn-dependent oxidoreductase
MGLVPDNEYMLGCECAGYVTRVAHGVTHFRVGDRVISQRDGTYANRIQCPVKRVHIIPDWMSFEDAASIPLVYLTSIYALYHLAGLREGQVCASLSSYWNYILSSV